MYVCMYVCMCVHVCMYVCMYVHVYVYVYVCVCVYVCMYVCTCVCVCVCMYMYVCTCMYVCMYVCIYMYVCKYVCSYVNIIIYNSYNYLIIIVIILCIILCFIIASPSLSNNSTSSEDCEKSPKKRKGWNPFKRGSKTPEGQKRKISTNLVPLESGKKLSGSMEDISIVSTWIVLLYCMIIMTTFSYSTVYLVYHNLVIINLGLLKGFLF